MRADWRHELEAAIRLERPLQEILTLLRHYKEEGVARGDVYSFLETLREKAPNEATDDRILKVADFVVGFCSPHMTVWDT